MPKYDMEELVEQLEKAGINCEDLDDYVHDLKSQEASAINNSGLEAQLEYIYGDIGKEVFDRAIKELIG